MERTKQRTKIKESTGERIFTGVIYAILILFCAIIVFPLLHIVSGSFSDPMALLRGEVSFWPKGFTFSMYEKVFKDASIWQGYGNTIVYTVLGTCISVVLTAFAAYPLSRKDFYGRNLFMGVFVFTMFFTGGMIPTFLIVQRLHLLNTMWALILPTAVSTYNLIIMRTFFESTIPFELVESASLDGCNDLVIFFRIVLPQAMRTAFPPLSNSLIAMVKDTSLAANITVTEMFMVTQRIVARTHEPLALYIEVGLIYLLFSTVLTKLQGIGEKKLSTYQKKGE